MKYMGSKNRLAKYILPFIHSFKDRGTYIEPFVGGANLIDKVNYNIKKGYDKNPFLISLLNFLKTDSKLPATIDETVYYDVRDNKLKYPEWYVGLVGFCASYGGRFFQGYPRGLNKNGTKRDYTNEAIRNLEAQQSNLKNIVFKNCDYLDLDFSNVKCTIYCDPPYKNSTQYDKKILGSFDHIIFWKWVRQQSKHNPVLVSEYVAPDDFIQLWNKDVVVGLKQEKTKVNREALFIMNNWINYFNKKSNNLF